MSKRSLVVLTCALLHPAQAAAFSDADVLAMLRRRVDVDHGSTNIVVGVVDAGGSRIIAYGKRNGRDGDDADGDTVYEIGSITKIFTSLLLADMAQHNQVRLDDPIGAYLPASQVTPRYQGRAITLGELASQVSGLPGAPDNTHSSSMHNPFENYTVRDRDDYLARVTLERAPGSRYQYSNFGVGLLGDLLAARAGVDYGTLVSQRITMPLGLGSTAVTPTPAMLARLATGYEMPGMPAPPWQQATLQGMGMLRSSASDLLRFVALNMRLSDPRFAAAMALMQQPRHAVDGRPLEEIGLGWHINRNHGGDMVWHNGGTAGYRTFIGFDRVAQRGVVLMTNSNTGSDDIARHLLNEAFPIAPPAAMHH